MVRASSFRAPSLGAGTDAVGGDLRRRVDELVATDEERALPRRVRVESEAFLRPGGEGDGTSGGVADLDGVLEDLAHPLVGPEGLAVRDPYGGEEAEDLRIARLRRLLLQQLVDGSQKLKSFGNTVLNANARASTNRVSGTWRAAPSGARPARKLATAVPMAPGM